MILKDAAGNVLAEVTPELDYAVVYVSTQDMAQGETYTLTAGTYSESITLSDIMYSTLNGGRGGNFGGGGPRGGMNGNMNNDENGGMQTAPDGNMHRGNKHDGMHNGGPGQGETPDGITGATELTGDTQA